MEAETPNLLILDLDETLIHATEESLEHEHDFLVGPYRVSRRPHLAEFLTSCSAAFRLAVWSSASDDYVREVVGQIIPPGIDLAFACGRSRCVRRYDPELFEEHPVKDLKKVKRLGYPLDRILIVVDAPRKEIRNHGNVLYLPPFRGNPEDRMLPKLASYLDSLRHLSSVRSVEKRGWLANLS
jgi:TFIIF-interacting CTD phosphatase-like protein